MKYRQWNITLILAGIVFLAGCGAGGIGTSGSNDPLNPTNLDGDPASVRISMQATEGTGPSGASLVKALELNTSDSAGTSMTLSEAWVNVEEFEVEIPGSCGDVDFELPTNARCETESESEDGDDSSLEGSEAEIKVEGPYQVDLMTGTVFPEIGPFQIPSGTVKEVKVKIAPLEKEASVPDGVPEELKGHSLVAQGTALINGEETPFSLSLKFDEEIEFGNLEGIPISEVVDVNEIILSLDVNQWFQGVDLESCVNEGEILIVEGTVLISEDSGSGDCSDIEDIIKDNIERSGSLDDDESPDDGGDDDHGDDS